jgi:uncharacterized protein DUF6494
MTEDNFNISVRKFLKKLGSPLSVTSRSRCAMRSAV